MSSGEKLVKLNTREKVISDDWNRAHKTHAFTRAEMMRHLVSIGPANRVPNRALGSPLDVDAFDTSVIEAPFGSGTGVRADIYEGLLVVPIEGTGSLHVTQGVVGLLDPDGQAGSSDPNPPDPDDSPYKVVKSAGVDTDGQLDVLANVSGSIRVDIVECQRTTSVLEQDNRDVFNNITGQFAPTLVDKVEEGQLVFRVRQGVPGAGLPALAQGWLPLCVASVPSGFVSVDDVTFWDVRPRVQDRVLAPFRAVRGLASPLLHNYAAIDQITVPAEARLFGTIEAEEALTGNLAGGRLVVDNAPGGESVDVRSAANQEPGFAPPGGTIYYVWALFPLGLPRWCRYSSAAVDGRRTPFGPKGIIVASTTAPASSLHSLPASTIATPAATGLAHSTAFAACLGAFPVDAAGVPASCTIDGAWTFFGEIAVLPNPALSPTNATGSLLSDFYDLVQGTHFPPNARAVRVRITWSGTGFGSDVSAQADSNIHVLQASLGTRIAADARGRRINGSTSGPGAFPFAEVYEVPRVVPLPPWPSAAFLHLEHEFNLVVSGGGGTKSSEFLTVEGWKLSD